MHLTRTTVITLVLLFNFAVSRPVFAQGQQGLTEEQLKTAAGEVPRLVELLQLKPGMTVADVGAGFGAWTMAFAKVLGPSGRVYATDLGERQIATMRESAKTQGLTNVTVLEGAERSTNLPEACCNAILIRDAYHHLTQPNDILKSMATALRPGGYLAVIDFPPRPNTEVPQGVPANRGGHGVPLDVVVSEVTAAGFTSISADKAWGTGPTQSPLFLLIFRKPAN
ncbi:MAG TPA: methyltransferase domain-containing protein [Terriglobia bacterium]|nr:methyltransferase domain-containing protein [Terriglobia bacterium]